jgi:putative DeoR family transcriptional regulator (stage III sporulation protein D)
MTSDDRLLKERCEHLADYIVESSDTVRGAAMRFGISKSTVHKDITEKLERVNPAMFREVQAILYKNKAERHLRGGEATKMKYQTIRDAKSKHRS